MTEEEKKKNEELLYEMRTILLNGTGIPPSIFNNIDTNVLNKTIERSPKPGEF